MEKLYKRSEELVTKLKSDDFFVARIKLTFLYSLTAVIILVVTSLFLYNTLILNLRESVKDSIPDREIGAHVLNKTEDMLETRFVLTDTLVIIFVIILGFLSTKETLGPIRENVKKQKRFIADASHELRTPITIAISGIEVALRNKNINLEIAKNTLNKTLKEMEDLSLLTNNLLDITKYDIREKNNYDIFNIDSLLKNVFLKMKPLAEEKDISLIDKINNQINNQTNQNNIFGNKIEIERVFVNIINNALTHTPKDGQITLSDANNKKEYVITISDTGVGIEKENLDKIFDPFFQGDLSRSAGGAGLGLTLAKKIIENHNGKITARSEVGKGTKIIITLPTL